MSTYLGGLVDSVVGLLAGETHVVVEKRFDEITLSSKVLFPLGLIVNEIVTNMIKHAFAGRECRHRAHQCIAGGEAGDLVLEDDGKGCRRGSRSKRRRGSGSRSCGCCAGSSRASSRWTAVRERHPVDDCVQCGVNGQDRSITTDRRDPCVISRSVSSSLGSLRFLCRSCFMGGWIGDTLWRAGVAAMLVVLAMRAVWPAACAEKK